jgi:hypothetical protein
LEHAFTVEMKSKSHVKNISISDEAHDRVLFEGNLGELKKISLAEGDVLELVGVNGVLRVDLSEVQLSEALEAHRRSSLSSEVGSYKSTKGNEVKRSFDG